MVKVVVNDRVDVLDRKYVKILNDLLRRHPSKEGADHPLQGYSRPSNVDDAPSPSCNGGASE
jgi:hypothetical protein